MLDFHIGTLIFQLVIFILLLVVILFSIKLVLSVSKRSQSLSS